MPSTANAEQSSRVASATAVPVAPASPRTGAGIAAVFTPHTIAALALAGVPAIAYARHRRKYQRYSSPTDSRVASAEIVVERAHTDAPVEHGGAGHSELVTVSRRFVV